MRSVGTTIGGTVTKARRVNGRNDLWEIHVDHSGSGDVSVTLASGVTCDGYAAICTGNGRMLSNSLNFTVSGPGQ